MERVHIGELRPVRILADLVGELLSRTALTPGAFWAGLANIVRDLGPRNQVLLDERDRLQATIDRWHREHREQPFSAPAYEAFLQEIEYLVPQPPAAQALTQNVDYEIAQVAGPQHWWATRAAARLPNSRATRSAS
jgi:malate synthase